MRILAPYRTLAEIPLLRMPIVTRRPSVVLQAVVFILCWMLRLRVVLTLDFVGDKLQLWLEDGWSRRRMESVTTSLSEFPKLAEAILEHPEENSITITTDGLYREVFSVSPPMIKALKAVVAEAWLDVDHHLAAPARFHEHGRAVWIRYEERLLLKTWRTR